MRSLRKGVMSATMRKREGIEPRNNPCCTGPRVSCPGSQHWYVRKGECIHDVPGSKSVAGERTVCIGTWESRIAPDRSVQQAEEARRTYGDTAVGLTHSRGVGGVMPAAFREPGALEGVSSRTQRDAEALALH